MKLIEPRYNSLFFIYLPFLAVAIVILYCWQQEIVLALKFFFPLFLLGSLLLSITPAGNYPVHHKQASKKPRLVAWLGRWLILELGLSIIYLAVKQIIMGSLHSSLGNTGGLPSNFLLLMQSGLYPWTLYVLLGLAFAYFSRDQDYPSIRDPLQPIYNGWLDRLFGVGVELAMKQGIVVLCCITIAILLTKINSLVSFFLKLPSNAFKYPMLIFTSCLTFLFLASPFWKRVTRYLEKKRYSFGTILSIIAFLVIFLSFFFNILIKLISPHQAPLVHLDVHSSPHIWALFSLIWWTAWAPVMGLFIARLARNYTIRSTIMAALFFPVCFVGLTWLAEHSFIFSKLIDTSISIIENKFGELVLALLACMITIGFFKSTKGIGIEAATQSTKQTVPATLTRTMAKLIVLAMFAYMITGISSLTLLAAGIIWFVFVNSSLSCMSLIIFAPYRSFVEKKRYNPIKII